MRKLIVTEFISVDGIAEVEKLPGVTWNDEMQKFKEDELDAARIPPAIDAIEFAATRRRVLIRPFLLLL
ncbi:hypothetical protein NKH74_20205 [Mesorhizobium sp. M0933]|uniref:hypothetical protein n=1 Tax=Mesorhizobium sp. M0933 TaxID=2957030 RepID=UPI003335E2B1